MLLNKIHLGRLVLKARCFKERPSSTGSPQFWGELFRTGYQVWPQADLLTEVEKKVAAKNTLGYKRKKQKKKKKECK